jgi:NADPH:quinone reductase
MSQKTRSFLLVKRPRGMLSQEAFALNHSEISDPERGEVLVRAKYFSVDPYMRNRMNDVPSYVAPFELNKPLEGDAIGEILQSKSDEFIIGDLVSGVFPWQEYFVLPAKRIHKIDTDIAQDTYFLSVLGLTGLTAYFGMMDIGKPKHGESVVVSGAAGAVGLVAGQIARLKGCYVVGIAGGEHKTKYLSETAGFDAVIDYKNVANVRKPLRKILPDGVDIYFDNVGGEISDSIMYILRDYARIILSGQISQYNSGRLKTGPRLLAQMIVHRAKMQGFIVHDYRAEFAKAQKELAGWLKQGKIQQPENIIEGFEKLPDALLGLFSGENIGKQLVKV